MKDRKRDVDRKRKSERGLEGQRDRETADEIDWKIRKERERTARERCRWTSRRERQNVRECVS